MGTVPSYLQRAWTKSHFDHVAIVLKYSQFENDNDVYVLEVIGNHGVRLVSWYDFRMQLGYFYEKICFRKLNHKLNVHQTQVLNEFRKQTDGNDYSLGIAKLLKFESSIRLSEDEKL